MTDPIDENPFVLHDRQCTTCMHRGVRKSVAQFVATGASGGQWFACIACIDALRPSFDDPMIAHVELWRAQMHDLQGFDGRDQVRQGLVDFGEALDQLEAAAEA